MTINKRFNGKCKGCGAKHSVFIKNVYSLGFRFHGNTYDLAVADDGRCYAWDNGVIRFGHACPGYRRLTLSAVHGKLVPEHVCNAKCLSSIRHVCECSCGGKNHGASWGNAA